MPVDVLIHLPAQTMADIAAGRSILMELTTRFLSCCLAICWFCACWSSPIKTEDMYAIYQHEVSPDLSTLNITYKHPNLNKPPI